MGFQIYPVDRTGALLFSDGYPDAILTKYADTLNDIAQSEIQLPYNSVHPWQGCGKHEIQIWEDGTFVDWLVPTKLKLDQGGASYKVTLSNFNWYLKKLVFGSGQSTNYLINGDFETDAVGTANAVTGWTLHNCTSQIINSNFERGTRAVQLSNATAGGADAYLQQIYTHTAGPSEPDYGIFTGWFYLNSLTDPPLDMRGLFLDLVMAGVSQLGGTWFPMMTSTPTGLWTRVQSAGSVPAGATQDFDLRLYCPNGEITWDACSFVFEESISAAYPAGSDQATIVQDIINYAMSKWSGFNFTTNCPATGILRMLAYQFVDHRKLLDSLQDFPKYPDGLDFWWSFNIPNGLGGTGQQRILNTAHPTKGAVRNDLPIVLNEDTQDFQWEEDLDRAATAVSEMSGQSGPSREEGYHVDTTTYGGLVMDLVEQAPEDTPIAGLDALALQRWKEISGGVVVPEVTTWEGNHTYLNNLKVGDQVPCTFMQNGICVAVGVMYRVMAFEMANPGTKDMKLTLNKVIV